MKNQHPEFLELFINDSGAVRTEQPDRRLELGFTSCHVFESYRPDEDKPTFLTFRGKDTDSDNDTVKVLLRTENGIAKMSLDFNPGTAYGAGLALMMAANSFLSDTERTLFLEYVVRHLQK